MGIESGTLARSRLAYSATGLCLAVRPVADPVLPGSCAFYDNDQAA